MPTGHKDGVAVGDEHLQGAALKYEADEDAAIRKASTIGIILTVVRIITIIMVVIVTMTQERIIRASYLGLGWSYETGRLFRLVSSELGD